MSSDQPFGEWLRQRRQALDLTQEELARQVGCSAITLRKLEAESRRTSKQIAERVAAGLLDQFPDGVWLVELAPLADPALVPQAVATVLDVKEEPSRPLLDALIRYLGDKSLLL